MKHSISIRYECPLCGHTSVRLVVGSKEIHTPTCYQCFTYDDDNEFIITWMDRVSIIQIIESDIGEPAQYIPSNIIYPPWSPSDDSRIDCDCGKCDNCPNYNPEGYCEGYGEVCPNSCDKCFSVTINKLRFLQENHFSYEETWSLDSTVSRFIIPRLQQYRKVCGGFPHSVYTECKNNEEKAEKKWDKILQSMVVFFKLRLKDFHCYGESKIPFEKMKTKCYNIGKKNFFKYFEHLWD
jgi:hypothetical protein